MRRLVILLAAAAMLAWVGPSAADVVWEGDESTDWHTSGNWDTGNVPASTDTGVIANGGTAVVTSAGESYYLEIASGSGTVGHVIVNSGNLSIGRDINLGYDNPDVTSPATFTQTGGLVSVGRFLMVGSGTNVANGGKGTYIITGGTLVAYRMHIGYGNDTAGQEGIFRIEGSGSTITITDDYYQTYGSPNQPGILQCVVDDLTGITKIDVTDTATFYTGSILDMDFLGATAPGTWDLMTAGSTANEGNLVLKAEDQLSGGEGWTIAWRDDGGDRTLSATYVPEPTSLAIMGLAGLGLLLRRRRR